MARISNQSAYPAVAPQADDYLIGTDESQSFATKTFALADISAFVKSGLPQSYVTLDTFQQISGRKNFEGGIDSERVVIQSAGSTNSQTSIANISGNFLSATGTNGIGFNEDNNIYFTKDNNFGGKGGVLAWNNTGNRTYTLPDASGNFALANLDNNFSVGQTIGGDTTINGSLDVNSGLDNFVSKFVSTDAGCFIEFNDNNALGYYLGSAAGSFVIRDTNDTERMRIDSSGNVGIGTDDPSAKLQLKMANNSVLSFAEAGTISSAIRCSGSIAFESDNNFVFRGEDGSNERMLIDSSGVTIAGSLSKGSGSFKIDHPLPEKKDTHHLVHSFVEAPRANNIYDGTATLVDGKAVINLDEEANMTEGTFVLLNRGIKAFTSNESDWDAVRGNVEGNILTIECQNPESTATVNWLVIGERQDQHMYDTQWTDENGRVITEPLKELEPTPSEEITE